MDIFDKEVASDIEIMRDIWVNYPETRVKRVETAKKWWTNLYEGKETNEINSLIDISMESLNNFKVMTRGNKKLCSKIVGEYFTILKDKYDNEIFSSITGDDNKVIDALTKLEIKRFLEAKENKMENRFLKEASKKAKLKKVESYGDMWEEIRGEVDSYFEMEYEKMVKLRKALGDSLMDKLGWDLTFVDDKGAFYLEELYNTALDDERLNYLLNLIGKEEMKKKVKSDDEDIRLSSGVKKELLGIHLSNDLIRLLPSELSLIHNKHLRVYFHSKYIENRLNTYLLAGEATDGEIKSEEKKSSKGPIILCLDTSSSMNGFPEVLAKASTLFLLRKAIDEGRKVYLIGFSGTGKLKEIEITNNLDATLEFFKESFHGGTDYILPMERSIELIAKKRYRKADVLMVTDGVAKVSGTFIERVEEIKKKLDFKIYSLVINNKNVENLFSDKLLYYHYKKRNIRKGPEYQFHNRGFVTSHG